MGSHSITNSQKDGHRNTSSKAYLCATVSMECTFVVCSKIVEDTLSLVGL